MCKLFIFSNFVRLGEWNLDTKKDCDSSVNGNEDCVDKPVQDIPIQEIIPHPDYSNADSKYKNDIALIRLVYECDYNDFVKPICLPLTDQLRHTNLDGMPLTVAGWGQTSKTMLQSNIKLKVNVNFVPLDTCRMVYPNQSLSTKQLCAGGVKGKDNCGGDSGGALTMDAYDNRRQYYYIVGVVSFGTTSCGQAGKPGVYTKVSEYIEWILATLRP
jgi:secreted trypsin-like serine protease